MWPRIVLLSAVMVGCVPNPSDTAITGSTSMAPGSSLTVRQNYQTAHRNVVEFAQSCYERSGYFRIQQRLDSERNLAELDLFRLPTSEPVGKVTLGEVDPRTSTVTTWFLDSAWASHGASFEAAAMGATAACRVP